MAKQRTTIPEDIASQVRWLSDDTCCICNEREKDIQLHHIDENPQNHSVENLAVLCLECHNKAHKKGGFARRLTPNYVTKYRDEWLETLVLRREEANKSDIKRRVREESSGDQPKNKRQSRLDHLQEYRFPYIYVKSLPKFKSDLVQQLKKQVSGGTTPDIVKAYNDYADDLISILITLADFCTAYGFLDHSLKEDCATIPISLKGVSEATSSSVRVSDSRRISDFGLNKRMHFTRQVIIHEHRIPDVHSLTCPSFSEKLELRVHESHNSQY